MSKEFQGDHPNYQQDHGVSVVHLAATATETLPVYRADRACRLRAVDLIPSASVTGDNTNTTQMQVATGPTAGTVRGAQTGMATGQNLTALTRFQLFGPSSANADAAIQLAAGDVVGIVFTKVGNGVLIPTSLVEVKIDYEP